MSLVNNMVIRKKGMRAWLCQLMLLVTVFAFTGSSPVSQSSEQHVSKTELLARETRSAKRTISFINFGLNHGRATAASNYLKSTLPAVLTVLHQRLVTLMKCSQKKLLNFTDRIILFNRASRLTYRSFEDDPLSFHKG